VTDRTDAQARILRAMERMGRLQREIAHGVARETDGTRAMLSIARLLDQAGEAGVGDIAEKLRVDMSVASRQVSELVDAGLVERTVADGDRRARSLRLTPEGTAYAERIRVVLRRRAADVFADWSDEDLAAAAGVFERIVESTARVSGCPPAGHLDASPPLAATLPR
jgi:DNA-binding MarR family transcriptional regulator